MAPLNRPSTAQLIRYFLYLGSLGFGGPVALVGYMQRDLVERRGWFTKDEYTKSLGPSQRGARHGRAGPPPAFLGRPRAACLAIAVTPEILGQVLWFFTKAGVFVFGSGLAIVTFSTAGSSSSTDG